MCRVRRPKGRGVLEITTPEVGAPRAVISGMAHLQGPYMTSKPSLTFFFFSFFSCVTWLWLHRLFSLSEQGLLPQGLLPQVCAPRGGCQAHMNGGCQFVSLVIGSFDHLWKIRSGPKSNKIGIPLFKRPHPFANEKFCLITCRPPIN